MLTEEAYFFNKNNSSKIEKELGINHKVIFKQHSLEDIFILIFRDYFVTKYPEYRISDNFFGATRNNWTIHTSYCIRSTCELLDLNCKFESLGRLDGVVETHEDKPKVVFFCEWEWNVEDIFGKGKEIEKIYNSLMKSREGKGFLVSYCQEKDYISTINKVAKNWRNLIDNKNEMTLYLLLVKYQLDSNSKRFVCASTIKINSNTIEIWEDLLF